MPTDTPESEHSRSSPDRPWAGVRVRITARLDYPAAHSMDATWFAVDGKGNVGVFFSGESGPVPSGAEGEGDLVRLLRQIRGEPEPDDEDDDDWDALEEADGEAVALGMFRYEYVYSFDVEFVYPYSRSAVPERPLHLDQLPPAVRKEFARARMADADFAADKKVQIVDHVACFFYSDEDVGYLLPGEKEVQPVPGRENKYATALPEFRKRYPKLKFADPPAAPKKKGKK